MGGTMKTLAAALCLLPAVAWAQAGAVYNGMEITPLAPGQTMQGDVSVSVPASVSTLVWTAPTGTTASVVFARVLRIVPNNATCTMTDDSTAATATSTPIPGGYVWNIVEPPPSVLSDGVTLASVHVFCTAAAVVSVSQGN